MQQVKFIRFSCTRFYVPFNYMLPLCDIFSYYSKTIDKKNNPLTDNSGTKGCFFFNFKFL